MFDNFKYAFLVPVLSILSCTESPVEPQKPEIYFGECTADINSQQWHSCPFAKVDDEDGETLVHIIGDVFNASGIMVESMSILNIPLVVGNYELDDWRSDDSPFSLFVYQHHDLALADYRVNEGVDAKGSVILTSYDSISRDVEGYFDCVLYLVQNPGKPDAPDSLVFTNGYFHTRIID